jgi:hypothetical protein
MSAAARAESARINQVAAALRKDTAEQLKRSREMEEAAGRKRAPSDVGISIVQCPKCAAKALLNADGTEIVRPVKGRRGELRSGERLSGSFDHNAAQEQADTEMEGQLRGRKRKAGEPAASKAPPRYVFIALNLIRMLVAN